MDNGERRISKPTAAIMVSVAIFIDIVQLVLNFLPGPGWILIWIVDVPTWLTFYVWFKMKGVSLTSRKAVNFVGGFFLEMIPVIDALPWWTIATILTIRTSWKEDAEAARAEMAARSAEEELPDVVGKIGPNSQRDLRRAA